MKKISVLSVSFAIAACLACGKINSGKKDVAAPPQSLSAATVGQSPDKLYGELYDAVEMRQVFLDSKTFADCTPKFLPADILKKYALAKESKDFNLKNFVLENFEPPVAHSSGFKSDLAQTPEQHVNLLWDVLTRQADSTTAGTLLPLPKNYIVPGGRFGEIYYWDSYFTMLGLDVAGRADLIENMVSNFAYLIDTYGHIPNGNRAYYLSRSQPPFFSLMVRLLDAKFEDKKSPDAPLVKFLPQLQKEYNFWMLGKGDLTENFTATRRVVRLGGPEKIMNRYWDDVPAPRPESYREDVLSAQQNKERPAEETYRNLKAAAESGWDFSSRWGASDKDVSQLRTVNIMPIDLNCLLWHLEDCLAEGYARTGDTKRAEQFKTLAAFRANALNVLFWDEKMGWYQDFDWVNHNQTGTISMAGIFPFWMKIADKAKAAKAAKVLEKEFLRPGGLQCTPMRTGQQWDSPNGWAPLQWAAVAGLRNYGQNKLADDIKNRWVKLCSEVYKRSGKMLEKYNVVEMNLETGGGEYPVQDGFGWTNGVLLKMLHE